MEYFEEEVPQKGHSKPLLYKDSEKCAGLNADLRTKGELHPLASHRVVAL